MPSRMQRVASADPAQRKPAAFNGPEAGKGGHCILRAGRHKPTAGAKDRAQPPLVETQDTDEEVSDHKGCTRLRFRLARLPLSGGQGITARFPASRESRRRPVDVRTLTSSPEFNPRLPVGALHQIKDQPHVAAKKPAKKAAKAVKKTSKPVAGSHAAPKPAGKKPVAKKDAPRKAEPKKAPVKKPVAKAASKPVATKPAASKPTGSKVASKKAPAQAVAKKPATKPSVTHHPASPTPKLVSKPVAKPVAKQLAQPAVSAGKPAIAPRPAGKVAVAVAAKPSAAPRKDKVKIVSYKTDQTTGRPILPAGYKPSPDEEYMGTLQVEYFRQRLQSWRADLVEESKQTIENLKDEVRDVGDEAERATRETENSLELRTRDRYRKLIGKIDSTLKRLDSGEYGYSVDSGEDIGLERLEARLTAERTIDEQERWEHLQKQIGD